MAASNNESIAKCYWTSVEFLDSTSKVEDERFDPPLTGPSAWSGRGEPAAEQ